ncbi:MAG: M20/M25/M40 family metallo-hydrolase [Planctomycetes bacterium]|nr:M20/M25/M40 family metallo-hydrolase [Planctomycetota bacterium]
MERLIEDLVDWIEIPSVTGDERDYGDALVRRLEALGFDCERQDLAPGRFNVLARAGAPRVVLCTHLDTVPPFFGSRRDREFVYGRGSCDAKGQAAAMIEAGRRLLAEGVTDFGYLFTAGEEVDSAGARLADARLAEPWRPRWVVIGEPTGNRFVRGHKGLCKATLVARGVAGHSSQDVGPSAVHELARCSCRLLDASWGRDDVLGPGTINIGEFHGGVASNVVADRAVAEVLVRTVEEPEVVLARLAALLGEHVAVAGSAKAYAPVRFEVPAGEDALVVAFGTDAPHMPRWGTPLLYGPGSILDAHTDGEKVPLRALEEAAARHVRTVRDLLAREDAS